MNHHPGYDGRLDVLISGQQVEEELKSAEPLAVTLARIEAKLDLLINHPLVVVTPE